MPVYRDHLLGEHDEDESAGGEGENYGGEICPFCEETFDIRNENSL